jgi:hypothetical protein
MIIASKKIIIRHNSVFIPLMADNIELLFAISGIKIELWLIISYIWLKPYFLGRFQPNRVIFEDFYTLTE